MLQVDEADSRSVMNQFDNACDGISSMREALECQIFNFEADYSDSAVLMGVRVESERLIRQSIEEHNDPSDLADLAEADDSANLASPLQAGQFVFAPIENGAVYRIAAFGESGEVDAKKCVGLHRLYCLVQWGNCQMGLLMATDSPQGGLPPADRDRLMRLDQLANESDSATDDALDSVAVSVFNARLKRLRKDFDDTDDPAVQAEIDEEIQKLEEYIANARGLSGRPRQIGSETEKWRPSIYRCLKTAYKRMRRSGLSKIAEHFELNVQSAGTEFQYCKNESRPAWLFDAGDL